MTKLVRGTVKRLCANKVGLDIRLDLVEGPMPEDDYFQLRHDHPNYTALYALARASAMNRLTNDNGDLLGAWLGHSAFGHSRL